MKMCISFVVGLFVAIDSSLALAVTDCEKITVETPPQVTFDCIAKINKELIALKAKTPAPRDAKGSNPVPSGTIVAWYPMQAQAVISMSGKMSLKVPQGWVLCDGENGAPDLRERFIYGTTDPSVIGAIGGKKDHEHTGKTNTGININGPKEDSHHTGGVHYHTFTTDAREHLPPFIKLVYIMKQ
jgi:hypothetical protein